MENPTNFEYPSEAVNPEPNHEAGDRLVKAVAGIEYAFRWCPSGTFLMGSPKDEEDRDDDDAEETQHEVTLTQGFWMLETPVTVEMFRSFTASTGYESQGSTPWGWASGWMGCRWRQSATYSWEQPGFVQTNTCPVVCVSWDDAISR